MPVYDNVPIAHYYPNPERFVRELYASLDIRTVLDVGAGHGGVFDKGHLDSLQLERREACDIHWVRPSDGWVIREGVDVQRLTEFYPEKSFDLVQCFECLEHVENRRAALEQLCAVAKKLVVITSADEMHHKDEDEFILKNPHQRYIEQPSISDLQELGFHTFVEHYERRQIVAWRYI